MESRGSPREVRPESNPKQNIFWVSYYIYIYYCQFLLVRHSKASSLLHRIFEAPEISRSESEHSRGIWKPTPDADWVCLGAVGRRWPELSVWGSPWILAARSSPLSNTENDGTRRRALVDSGSTDDGKVL